MNNNDSIVAYCERNQISATLLADALDKTGHVPHVYPLRSIQYQVGKIKCIFAAYGSNYNLHKEIVDVSKNDIVVVFAHECQGRALLGEIVAQFLFDIKKIKALVVHGAIRDVAEIMKNNYSIWCNDKTPIGCVNYLTKEFPEFKRKELFDKYEGAVAICDSTGVIAIPKTMSSDEVLDRIRKISNKEYIWHYCLEHMSMNTFEIICKNEYLKMVDMLPDNIKKKVKQL